MFRGSNSLRNKRCHHDIPSILMIIYNLVDEIDILRLKETYLHAVMCYFERRVAFQNIFIGALY